MILLVNDNGTPKLVEMREMAADAEVLGQVIADIDTDPLIACKNPYAGPHDGWAWPDNMFSGPVMRLSKIREISEAMDRRRGRMEMTHKRWRVPEAQASKFLKWFNFNPVSMEIRWLCANLGSARAGLPPVGRRKWKRYLRTLDLATPWLALHILWGHIFTRHYLAFRRWRRGEK